MLELKSRVASLSQFLAKKGLTKKQLYSVILIQDKVPDRQHHCVAFVTEIFVIFFCWKNIRERAGKGVFQMGGPEGVRRMEVYKVTLAVEGGLKMLCHPRVVPEAP